MRTTLLSIIITIALSSCSNSPVSITTPNYSTESYMTNDWNDLIITGDSLFSDGHTEVYGVTSGRIWFFQKGIHLRLKIAKITQDTIYTIIPSHTEFNLPMNPNDINNMPKVGF